MAWILINMMDTLELDVHRGLSNPGLTMLLQLFVAEERRESITIGRLPGYAGLSKRDAATWTRRLLDADMIQVKSDDDGSETVRLTYDGSYLVQRRLTELLHV